MWTNQIAERLRPYLPVDVSQVESSQKQRQNINKTTLCKICGKKEIFMASKEEEAKRLTEGNQDYSGEQPPPYPGGYGYPVQGQGYPPQGQGYPPQQGQPQPGFGQPHYGQPQLQYGQPMMHQQGPYPQQVIIVSPQPISNPPADHLVFNIIMTLCCCWPIGIFAIVKSLECRTAIQSGDRPRAESLSRSAKRLGMWTLGAGIATLVIFIVIFIVTFVVVPYHYVH